MKKKLNTTESKNTDLKDEKITVTKEMTFSEIMEKRPDALQKLSALGLGCVGCHFAAFDTLENGASIHGMEVEELLEELND